MSALDVVDAVALGLPGVTKALDDGRPGYSVGGKWFCFHRKQRKDTGDLTDVFVFRVDGLEEKELLLADVRGIFFTTPHWGSTAAVLTRIPQLDELDEDELRDLVIEAWLTRAPKRVAKAWLTDQEVSGGRLGMKGPESR